LEYLHEVVHFQLALMGDERYMIHASQVTETRYRGYLLGLLMTLSLVGCASWASPTPPSTAFDDDATACQVEVMQATPTSDLSESNQYDAYIACLHGKGW